MQEGRNVFFSPASIMYCLSMLHDGATGETRHSIANVLGIDQSNSKDLRARLTSALQSAQSQTLQSGTSLWCSKKYSVRSDYIARARELYEAEIALVDLDSPNTGSMINRWVSRRTRGRISHVVDTLEPLAALVAVNAIYFKDLWENPFSEAVPMEDFFHAEDGRVVTAAVMSQHDSYLYLKETEVEVIGVRYINGRTMYIFLPGRTSTPTQFVQGLTAEKWEFLISQLQTVELDLFLPRFQLADAPNLTGALQNCGMGMAFDRMRAQFDGMCFSPSRMWVSEILHCACINVDEKGTEAAASSGATLCWLSSEEPIAPSIEVIVDRPFLFAVCDSFSGMVLFMGVVEEPGC